MGEQPQAAIQAGIRLFQTNNRTLSSGSIRPAVILPSGCDVCNDEYRIAATLDFFQHDTLSFYVGGGVAINKDGETGKGYGMVSGGVEVNLSPTFAITGNVNLIPESDAQSDRGLNWADAETSLLLTARF